ncbi:MAG: metallophosphoesterase [Gemmatimonadota bacterium]|nr:metallophosphoesterase [Gemmatimonadota bacterium]
MPQLPLSRRSFLTGIAGAAALGLPRRIRGRVIPTLSLPPFLARPTTASMLVSVRNGEVDAAARLEVKRSGPTPWRAVGPDRLVRPGEFMTWTIDALGAGTDYEYRLLLAEPGEEPAPAAGGRFTTQREGEVGFTAALSTDAHTGSFPEGSVPVDVLDDVVRNVARDRPDFMLALGDNVAWYTSRELPQDDARGASFAYDMYRRHLAPLSPSCPHFGLIGNWEGESGKFPEESIERVATVRRRFAPGPDERTYPQGGSPDEDYYAFGWGPALFVALNVQTYSEPSGELDTVLDDVTRIGDWTLGAAQMAWLEGVLETSDHPFKFVCIHHAVGGNAGNPFDTLYGRGGPRAATVGEQALVHEMMREFGVQIFFFGHDHVFLDEVVGGIHYALPGSCGAPWKFGPDVTGYDRYWSDSGHGRLTVRPDRAMVEYLDRAGRPIHRFSVDPA